MYSFEAASAIWMAVQPGAPAASAQSNWMAAASEAQQLAAELLQNLDTLRQYWSGEASEAFDKSMRTLAGFATDLSEDMANMAKGLSQMSAAAEKNRAQAMIVIATHQDPRLRWRGAIKLNQLMTQTGSEYQSAKSTYWKEPTQAPDKLPHKNKDNTSVRPDILQDPGEISSKRDLSSKIPDLLKILPMLQDGLGINQHEFSPGSDGGRDSIPAGPLPVGALPADDPSFKPVPIPDTNFTEPEPIHHGTGTTGLAGAAPTIAPTTGLATNGGAMSAPGGGMGAMGMMGAAGMAPAASSARSAPKAGGSPTGLFGPPMMGGAQKREEDEESGMHTWLTEDDMAWDGDAAPSAVTGRG
ncbi:hypothetical protein Afil01_20240 [Actinorhabdospora filicis]|uniref:PPE family domain-containing protein n=1 Tax=Actinorhabdospora filicis TaxID=1785913 RepID=A0A9W6SJR1_9ACTN|nr:WXG100 family type VII secretion target [Actinorhabdospora filicis]GLZ77217.1 hypothetical protein Afil01_20240 [Actinorhabdospora filicis]